MSLRRTLLERAEKLSRESGKSLSTMAQEAIGDRGFFTRLRQGADCTTGTYDRVSEYLAGEETALGSGADTGDREAAL